MKDAIRRRALELGFSACGFATPEPPATGPHFQRWIGLGHHGEMAYLARNASKRLDPNLVLPGIRSVVALAASYSAQPSLAMPSKKAGECHGTVARYARHADYHEVLRDPLEALAGFVDGLGGPGARSLWYVDTGPVLERDLAQRAGIGFIGKHTNLIGRRLGNWFLLAEILTTVPIEPDAPEKNRCGSCTRCLSACPTAAITAPFELDARRCISYLTIEAKGPIPVPLRSLMGDRVFGCDDCLEACPWNRFSGEARLMGKTSRPDLYSAPLENWLGMDEDSFRKRFAGTPMLRAKRKGLLRNVCVALGNVGGNESLPALSRATLDPEPLIQEHARWALENIQARGSNSKEFSLGFVKPHVDRGGNCGSRPIS